MKIFLCGDVMTGRGVDLILPHPSSLASPPPADDPREYVALAERASGPIPQPASFSYVWGDASAEFARMAPHVRIVNLETSVTRSESKWPDKVVHYRMSPDNVACLEAAGIDVCVLANNHVLDYSHAGLLETIDTLHQAGLKTAGAGRDLAEAQLPAVVDIAGGGRVLVSSFATRSSGVPREWAAREKRAGVWYLRDVTPSAAERIAADLAAARRPGDTAIASIHWGGNWGYDVPDAHVSFAHALIDAGVDLVHGHSSHHPRPIELYRGKLILYGCGDFIDDYEGISGYEAFRDDLVLMYFATLDPQNGRLDELAMTPMQIRRMSLTRASAPDTRWLRDTLGRISERFRTRVSQRADGRLTLENR